MSNNITLPPGWGEYDLATHNIYGHYQSKSYVIDYPDDPIYIKCAWHCEPFNLARKDYTVQQAIDRINNWIKQEQSADHN